jgi:hypothetical protein
MIWYDDMITFDGERIVLGMKASNSRDKHVIYLSRDVTTLFITNLYLSISRIVDKHPTGHQTNITHLSQSQKASLLRYQRIGHGRLVLKQRVFESGGYVPLSSATIKLNRGKSHTGGLMFL